MDFNYLVDYFETEFIGLMKAYHHFTSKHFYSPLDSDLIDESIMSEYEIKKMICMYLTINEIFDCKRHTKDKLHLDKWISSTYDYYFRLYNDNKNYLTEMLFPGKPNSLYSKTDFVKHCMYESENIFKKIIFLINYNRGSRKLELRETETLEDNEYVKKWKYLMNNLV